MPSFFFLFLYQAFELKNPDVITFINSILLFIVYRDFPGGSDGKVSAYNAGDPGLIPVSGRSPGEGNGNQVEYSCLENPMHRGAWLGYSPWGCKELDKTE